MPMVFLVAPYPLTMSGSSPRPTIVSSLVTMPEPTITSVELILISAIIILIACVLQNSRPQG